MPETVPPPPKPDVEPKPSEPKRAPKPSPFNPDWPKDRPLPQPKGIAEGRVVAAELALPW